MLIEQFESLAKAAMREAEGLRLEFIDGKMGAKAVPDGLHETIIMWLVRQCLQHHPSLDLHTGQGLKIETYRKGRARPDGTLAPIGHFVQAGEWAEPDGVLMTVEVTSHDYDTNQRDRVEKPRAYAESGIPVYLLIDRDADEVTVYSEPVEGTYQDRHTAAFGKSIELPAPVGFTLDTETLRSWKAARESDG
ncbi:Uma2 family endonuclease [Streptomyces sp. UNOB3_S3]|nr:Uma2 family endonuclease [Streptomyces sp. UNOB3_S3]MCC3778585.1 Uma2 family endonuclease [Streptomyces sp. UNOB3_S3]